MHIAAQTILWIVGTCAGFNAAVFAWISYRRDLYRDPTTWFLVGGLAAFSAACIVTALDAWSDDWAKAAWALLAISTTALLIRRRIATAAMRRDVQDADRAAAAD